MVDIYSNIYNIITEYIFGGVLDNSNEELITIALASIGSIFVFVLPFLIVWRVVRLFVN